MRNEAAGQELVLKIPLGQVAVEGDLGLPAKAQALVVFAHGSGSSRHSPRDRFVAKVLRNAGLATLLFDLLTHQEEAEDNITARLRFDVSLLSQRLATVTDWLRQNAATRHLGLGYFGASTGAAAERPDMIGAVVSRGGRPDLASGFLPRVKAATLLIVGGRDYSVIEMNRQAPAEGKGRKSWLSFLGQHTFSKNLALWKRWPGLPATGLSAT